MTPATLISKATIRSGIRIPFRQRRVPGRFPHPCLEWPDPARHGASAPCLGAASSSQQVLQGDYWVQIPGTVHRQTSIQIRYRSNFAVSASQMRNAEQLENRAHTRVSPSALVNQPPLHTHPALGRRLDRE